MNTIQIIMLVVLCVFYLTYLSKMLLLRRQGIRGNIMGKGNKPKAALFVELFLRAVTLLGAFIQFGSVLFPSLVFSIPFGIMAGWIGLALSLFGCVLFALSVIIMKNNWRAGFNSEQETELVTGGIYGFSRNPAFVGFDSLYIGCAFAFPTIINVLVAILALILFHMQIKGEEVYLYSVFGQQYADYAAQVSRYLGRRK